MTDTDQQGGKIPRPMIISWLIDGVLAVAILAAVLKGGQFIERLDTVVGNMEKLSERVSALETRPMGPGAQARISVLEAADANQQRTLEALKSDITSRLDRMEDKMDSIAEVLRSEALRQ